MFTSPAPSAPTLSTTTSPASSTSPGRSRLRGLSYLRNYTQNHLHVRSDSDSSTSHPFQRPPPPSARPAAPRSQSAGETAPLSPSPSPPPPSTRRQAREQTSQHQANTSTRRSPSPQHAGVTSGWLPTVAGRGPSRAQQFTTSDLPSSEPAPTVTTTLTQSNSNHTSIPTSPATAMTRSRAETAAPALTVRNTPGPRTASADGPSEKDMPSIRLIPHYDPRANRPSLSFPAITRTLPTESAVIRVGRYSERENAPEIPINVASSAPVGFKSKVVSRRHCEFWCQNSQWYVKDVKSSSGTFLNHLRLSPPGIESRAYPVNDGDVVQLGIDFRGGEEMIFRCVKIRIECNRGWQKALNNFNKKTHNQLRALAKPKPKADSDASSVNSSECSICLMSIAPCQSLFVAPCSHVWHYKCIRPILTGHTWPNFLCPNCRAVADLEADVDEQEEEWEDQLEDQDSLQQAIAASRETSIHGITPDVDDEEEPDGVRTPRAMEPLDRRSPQHEILETQALGGSSSAAAASNRIAMVNDRIIPDEEPLFPNVRNCSDLADLTSNLSLTETHTVVSATATDEEDDYAGVADATAQDTEDFSSTGSSSSLAAPRAIPARSGSQSHNFDLRAANGSGVVAEGPMTPRNDAGPFVLDGGAGRNSTGSNSGLRRGMPGSLDAHATENVEK